MNVVDRRRNETVTIPLDVRAWLCFCHYQSRLTPLIAVRTDLRKHLHIVALIAQSESNDIKLKISRYQDKIYYL